MTKSKVKEKIKNYISRNRVELIAFISGIMLIHSFLLQDAFRGEKIIAENASQFGSFISGYIGTMCSLLSAVLLFSTLKSQRQSSEIEKFESRFFELLRLHKENVNEIEMGQVRGRIAFVMLLRDFRIIFKLTEEVYKEYQKNNIIEFNVNDKINIAYLSFYYGTGPNSTRILKNALAQYPESFVKQLVERFDIEYIDRSRDEECRLFEGHQARLGNYYRHLYQTVTYVHDREININKQEYIKILRAQLSNHEQALLVFNALSDLGKEWIQKDLINEYKLIKNIPKDFIDSKIEIDIKALFPNLKFEWEN